MNRIDSKFAELGEEGRAGLIVFLTAGDPDLETTRALVPALVEAGADMVELGVPHSDPIAEGPTIQAASTRALRHRTSLVQILELCRELRTETDVPLVLMGYLNNLRAYGEEKLVDDATSVGVDGLIVADAPFEEALDLQHACDAKGVHRILLVAPTSTPQRVVQIATRTRGFAYCVSVTGVTGARTSLPSDLSMLVGRIRRVCDTPIGVGFGISTPDQAAEVARLADAVIVGSALVQRIGTAPTRSEALRAATRFVETLRDAIHTARA
ncbi:MAG: tryptophan synthase subunit alpha [Myxococcota bacterium]